MPNSHHRGILALITQNSNKATQHTFKDNYLGTSSPRYAISVPVKRKLAKAWMASNRELKADDLAKIITSLVKGESSTEKMMAGILLDYATPEQRKFKPEIFDKWIAELTGWAEVDAMCSGNYTVTEIPDHLATWKKILTGFSKSKNIQKRRAALVMLVAPLRKYASKPMADLGLAIIEQLKSEKEILITKAISWLLRSMAKHHAPLVQAYVEKNKESLPAIAVRETLFMLKTGRKTKRKKAID